MKSLFLEAKGEIASVNSLICELTVFLTDKGASDFLLLFLFGRK